MRAGSFAEIEAAGFGRKVECISITVQSPTDVVLIQQIYERAGAEKRSILFGHRVVEGKNGKEVVDIFDKRHPGNKKSIGGSKIALPPSEREMLRRKLMDIHGLYNTSHMDIEF